MNTYQKELQAMRRDDEIQTYSFPDYYIGYAKIGTAGHGYLVVPKDSRVIAIAQDICGSYGYDGRHAVYLEEDCDAYTFIKKVTELDHLGFENWINTAA